MGVDGIINNVYNRENKRMVMNITLLSTQDQRWQRKRMISLQRPLLILFVLSLLISGLGYDPLSTWISGVAPFVLPGLLLAALVWTHIQIVASAEKQWQQRCLEIAQDLQVETAMSASRFDEVQRRLNRLGATTQGLKTAQAEQTLLLPARMSILQKHYDDAIRWLQDTVEQYPESMEARWLLGEALVGNKRYAEALPHLRVGLVEEDIHRLSLIARCEQSLGYYTDAEKHLVRLIEMRGDLRQQDLVNLGMVQSELEPHRATVTLSQALELNPFNSAARYQLIDLRMKLDAYDEAIALATDGLECNRADIGCYVSRADARFRRGNAEDEPAILDDLAAAQAKNRRDYNIYRLRGAVYQRRASQIDQAAERRKVLQEAIEAYEEGLRHVPPKFQAHLLAAESRVFLQLNRFEEAVTAAQSAVQHASGHVSNHLALALAQLSAGKWRAAVQAAEQGMPWAGWGGRIWLNAIDIFANACAGVDPSTLRAKCGVLVQELSGDSRHFELSDTWGVVRDVLSQKQTHAGKRGQALIRDTIGLLERKLLLQDYQRAWGEAPKTEEVA
jgi:tetratricopeptide (TPR) repeat protein